MHFALLPFIVGAVVGAAAGWIVRDREYFKPKHEQGADAQKTVSDAAADAKTASDAT